MSMTLRRRSTGRPPGRLLRCSSVRRAAGLWSCLWCCVALIVCLAAPARAQGHGTPSYRLDAGQSRVVELTGLFAEPDCHPDRIQGRVAQRRFDASGLLVQSVVVEQSGGHRTHLNVDTEHLNAAFDRLGMAARGWIVSGLQTLLAERNRVSLGIRLCGAAGRVIMVESVRLAR